jgi:hypothetical protein
VHTWRVNGSLVNLADIGIEPLELRHDFGRGSSLTLAQPKQHHRAGLLPSDEVTYLADGVVRFIGKVRSQGRRAQGSTDSITYTVQDELARAASITIELDSIDGAWTVGTLVKAALQAAGVSINSAVIESIAGDPSVKLPYRGPLSDLLDQAMRAAPSWRLRIEPSSGTSVWTAVQIFGAGALQSLQWGGSATQQSQLVGRVASLDLSESVDGCYTAVQLVRVGGERVSYAMNRTTDLSPAWNSSLESNWAIDDTGTSSATPGQITDASLSTDATMVYRAFEIADSVIDFNKDRPWKMQVAVPASPRLNTTAVAWVSIEAQYAEIETGNGFRRVILAQHPVTVAGNVRVPGKARGSSAVKLVYLVGAQGITSQRQVRVPTTGWQGSAFTRYGVQALKRVEVGSNSSVTSSRAQTVLDALKDVRTTGSIAVYGQMPTWAWPGGSRVRVQGSNSTGVPVLADYQAVELRHTGWSVQFAANTFSLQVTDDRSAFADLESPQ